MQQPFALRLLGVLRGTVFRSTRTALRKMLDGHATGKDVLLVTMVLVNILAMRLGVLPRHCAWMRAVVFRKIALGEG